MIHKLKILLFFGLVFFTSCLDDDLVPIVDFNVDESAKLLRYFEGKGDFPNSLSAPALINASDIYNFPDNKIILDLRTVDEYAKGHIANSVNISNSVLFKTVETISIQNPDKIIVLVSKNGQASAYYTCLLRLAGFDKVFSLNYGMASWHQDFAAEWLNALGDAPDLFSYTNYEFDLNPYSSLPTLGFPDELKTVEEKALYRINSIISSGFDLHCFTDALDKSIRDNHYVICYGKAELYGAPMEYRFLGHPDKTVWFKGPPSFDFKSTNNLQRVPGDKKIIIYSGDGQLSACIVAYLRALGYDAKTLLFGANQLFYGRLTGMRALEEYVFSVSDIMNYPYITGN